MYVLALLIVALQPIRGNLIRNMSIKLKSYTWLFVFINRLLKAYLTPEIAQIPRPDYCGAQAKSLA